VENGIYRIPDLELDLVFLNGKSPRAELDANRQICKRVLHEMTGHEMRRAPKRTVDRLEALVGELEQEARLANSCGEQIQIH
jgi:hypothetical protein